MAQDGNSRKGSSRRNPHFYDIMGTEDSDNGPDLTLAPASRSTGRERSANAGRREERTGREERRAERRTGPEPPERNPVWKKNKKPAGRRRRRGSFGNILLGLFLLLLVCGGLYIWHYYSLIQRLPWDPEEVKNEAISEEKAEQMSGYWTVAVFGVDSRDSDVGSGNNADVNIVCNINHDTGEIRLVSVYRDVYLKTGKSNYGKLNSAYMKGGPEQAVKTLNTNLDLDIDDYATFNWKAVAEGVNLLGGLDLEITEPEFEYINAFITETVEATGIGSHQLKHAGMNHLDGVQAVAYGRLRLMDSDYERTARQRKIIALSLEKAKKADWHTVHQIILTVFPQVATSADLEDILTMGRGISRYHIGATYGFPETRSETRIRGASCVVARNLALNVKYLHEFLFGDKDYKPTSNVWELSDHIQKLTGLGEVEREKEDKEDKKDQKDKKESQ